MRGAYVLGLALALLYSARVATAQPRDFDTHRFVPALDAQGFIGVPGTATPGSLRPTFGMSIDYALAPLDVPCASPALPGEPPVYCASVDHRVAASISGQLGLGSRGAIGVLVPVALYQVGEPNARPELAPVAMGDPLIAARYRLLGAASDDPLMPKDGPGLGIELSARLPVGSDSTFMGAGRTRLGGRLLFDMQLLGAGIGGMVGFESHVPERSVFGGRLRNALELGAGAKVPLPSLHPFSAVGELRALINFQADERFEGEIGLRAALGELTVQLTGGGGFVGEFGAPDARIIASVWFAPAVSDTDRDGIDDDDDECPPLAEDPDGFEDEDGCPDPDNDNDLVPDIDDLCPNVEALEGQDEDEDGCTDAAKPAG